MARVANMLSATGSQFNVTGNKIRADAYYGFTDGLHTISIHPATFTGRVTIQATLVVEPVDADWFNLDLTDSTDAIEFTDSSEAQARTFQGNFVYLRVVINRDYLGSGLDNDDLIYGQVTKVLLSN